MLENLTDAELISEYLESRNRKAFDVLLRRHYNYVYRMCIKRIKHEDDAHDLCQKVWLRVIEHLEQYQDEGKFPHYLSVITTNIIKDHWRRAGIRDEMSLDAEIDGSENRVRGDTLAGTGGPGGQDAQEAMHHLVHTLIPGLPCDLRTVYLLRHESEYWDGRQPLRWHHLASLNAQEIDSVLEMFEAARNKLFYCYGGKKSDPPMSCEEQLVFLVWTQAQRLDKKKKFTEQYFADLLNIPLNTFKTRYRNATHRLQDGLRDWR